MSAEALSARQLVDRVRGVQPVFVEGFISCHSEWSYRDKEWSKLYHMKQTLTIRSGGHMATELNFTSTVARKYFKP